MANRFTVWTDLRVRGTGLTKEVGKARGAFGRLAKSIARTKDIAKGVLIGGGLYAGLAQIGLGVRSVTDDFISLDHSITSAGARFGEAFNRGTAGFDRLTAAARETGAVTEHTAAQAGDGLSFMAMAGFSAADSMALLPDIADLATAANLDFARSSDIASDALGAFGKNTGTAEEKASAFKSIMDQAAKSTNTANMDLNMWFESIRESAPSFVTAGQKMSTLNTFIAELANNGKKGATSGYMLRNVINRLAAPVGKGKTALKMLNVQVADSEGNFRDMVDVMADLGTGLDKLGEVKRTKAIKEIFGERAVAGMNILFAKGSEGLRAMRKEIEDNENASSKLANKMRGSVQNRIAKIKSAATELGLKFFEAFGPKIESAISKVSGWLDDANSNSKGWIGTLKDLAGALSTTAKFIVENRDVIYGMIKSYMAFKAAGVVMDVSRLATGWAGVGTEIVGATSKVSMFQKAMSGINAVAIGAAIGAAIGTAIWQTINTIATRREKRQTTASNKATMTNLAAKRGDLSYGELVRKRNEIKADMKSMGTDANAGSTEWNEKLQGMKDAVESIDVATSKKQDLMQGGPSGMFGAGSLSGVTQFDASRAAGAQSIQLPKMEPVFNVEAMINVDGQGQTTASVDVKPAPGPTPNNAGALP